MGVIILALQTTLMELGKTPLYKVDRLQQPDEIERRLTAAYQACCDIGVALTKANMALALGLSSETLNDWIAGKYKGRDGVTMSYADQVDNESEQKAIMAVASALKKWVIVSQSMLEIGSQINKTPAGSIFLLKAVHHLVEIEQDKTDKQLNLDTVLSLYTAYLKSNKQ